MARRWGWRLISGSTEGPADLAAEAIRSLEGIDILVNNAGEYRTTTWEGADPRDWEDLYRRNVTAAVGLVRELVPGMRERRWGRVIQIASGEATNPSATMPDYAATKAALVNLSVSLAKSLDRTGVTANTVSPGIVVTRGVERFYRATARERGWGESWHEIEGHVLGSARQPLRKTGATRGSRRGSRAAGQLAGGLRERSELARRRRIDGVYQLRRRWRMRFGVHAARPRRVESR